MALDFVERVKGFIFNPVENFNKYKDEDLAVALKYYIVLLVIFSILSALSTLMIIAGISLFTAEIPGLKTIGFGILLIIGTLVFMVVAGLIALFIESIIIHIFVIILGGKQGFVKTVQAMIYSSTPSMLLSWIPVIGFIAGIWALILAVIGIREIQEMSTTRAALAVVLPVVIVVVLVVLIFMYLMIGIVTSTPLSYNSIF